MFMPRPVAVIVDKLARQSVGRDWGLYAALLEHWAEIVGSDYAAVTTPVKIAFPQQRQAQRGQGMLTIRLPKGLAMEFSFRSEIIRQRINGYFGHEAIARIVLEPGFAAARAPAPLAPPLNAEERASLETGVGQVGDATLREALLSFGEALLRGANRTNAAGR